MRICAATCASPRSPVRQGFGALHKLVAAPQAVSTRVKLWPILESSVTAKLLQKKLLTPRGHHKETSMTYFTIADFILVIPMALAGALFVGALPCKTELRHNVFRLIGALLGVGVAVLLVEGLPALV